MKTVLKGGGGISRVGERKKRIGNENNQNVLSSYMKLSKINSINKNL